MDLNSLLVSLYVLVDDRWKLNRTLEPPKVGRPAYRLGGHHPGYPRPESSFSQRA